MRPELGRERLQAPQGRVAPNIVQALRHESMLKPAGERAQSRAREAGAVRGDTRLEGGVLVAGRQAKLPVELKVVVGREGMRLGISDRDAGVEAGGLDLDAEYLEAETDEPLRETERFEVHLGQCTFHVRRRHHLHDCSVIAV